jgi:uncharacterized protein
MAQDLYQYNQMVETALRGVAREALARAARDGLRGGHHFYITFRTGASGVVLPPQILAKYPEDMTIVLQHQFWGLEVSETSFSVTLSFSNRMERLTVPFAAVTTFADPSVKFGLQFEMPSEAPAGPPATAGSAQSPAALPAGRKAASLKSVVTKPTGEKPTGEKPTVEKPTVEKNEVERPAAEIVTLDRFRKR